MEEISDWKLDVLAGCDEGPCPKVGRRAARPGFAIVQGTRVAPEERSLIGDIPGHEDVVEVPEEVLLQYAMRMRAEGRI